MNKNSQVLEFNLFLSSHAVLGALASIHELMAEIPPEGTEERLLWENALAGLAWAGRRAAQEMNVFLHEASDRHRFPNTYSDIEYGGVKEAPALYVVG